MFLILIAQIASCQCSTPPSTVILDGDGTCLYWYWNDEPDKHNPCQDIPGNAFPIWPDHENETGNH